MAETETSLSVLASRIPMGWNLMLTVRIKLNVKQLQKQIHRIVCCLGYSSLLKKIHNT